MPRKKATAGVKVVKEKKTVVTPNDGVVTSNTTPETAGQE